MKLSPDAPSFLQRYIAAYFYFATSIKGPWRYCNPPKGGEDFRCTYRLYSTGETRHDNTLIRDQTSIRWLSDKDECGWAGIHCVDGQIRKIDVGE